ncbi:MAG: signal peptide peptidase SppA [Bacteroidales bacterium]|nr:signal peptide peptidase SppA [Bacteroidales bacterium]
MKQFFKFLLSSFIGTILALIFLFFILVGSIAALIPSKDVTMVKENSILRLDFAGPITDRTPNNPFENIDFASFEPSKSIGLNDILKSIKKAGADDNIKGIYLNLSNIEAGMATTTEIRQALEDFKSTGKFIIAYGEYYSQKAYYLASVADKVFLHPQGLIEHAGLRSELMFFKKALDKYSIEPQIIRGSGNKFKSAVEPFMYEKMSDANRLQTETYMGSIWHKMLSDVSASRGISEQELNRFADEMLIRNATSTLTYHMTDSIVFEDEVLTYLSEKSGRDKDDDPRFVELSKYKDVLDPATTSKGIAKDKVAIVYASGEITMGKGSDGVTASETMAQAIREARKDSTVKAIVLRVNSPGGSALASDIILRELNLARAKKPVIVSMGDVAASGGYYIACMADSVIASENTITGSIGVFGLFFNIGGFLDENIGITVDRVKTNEHADLGSMTRNLTDAERMVVQQSVDEIYDAFLGYVAEGRGKTKADVDSIGQGRVWSGENALALGLIDSYGGLSKAIEIAAQKAGLDHYRTVDFPEQEDPFEMLLENLNAQAESYFLKSTIGDNYKHLQYLQDQLNNQGILARLPFSIDIQ